MHLLLLQCVCLIFYSIENFYLLVLKGVDVEVVGVEEGVGTRDTTEDIVDLHLLITVEEAGEDTRDPDHVNVNTAHVSHSS